MEKIECPNCGEACISTGDKLKAGKWKDIYCPNCNQRLCANPIVMAIMYFMLVWDISFFGFMAVIEKSWIYATVGIVIWAILEFFIYFIPLTRLRPKTPKSEDG